MKLTLVTSADFQNARAFAEALKGSFDVCVSDDAAAEAASFDRASDIIWFDGLGETFWRYADEEGASDARVVVRLATRDERDADALGEMQAASDVVFPDVAAQNRFVDALDGPLPFRVHVVTDRPVGLCEGDRDTGVRLLHEIATTPRGPYLLSETALCLEAARCADGRVTVVGADARLATDLARHLADAWGLDARAVAAGRIGDLRDDVDTVILLGGLVGRAGGTRLADSATALVGPSGRLLAVEESTSATDAQASGDLAIAEGLSALFPGCAVEAVGYRWWTAASPSATEPAPRTYAPRTYAPRTYAPRTYAAAATRDDPFVSVLIPVYNDAPRIGRCIDSVLAGRYRNIEVVVVDDGSTDATPHVVAGIRDERVRYVRKEHSGRPETRNRAVEEARADLIAWLDSDDLAMPNRLRAQVDVLLAEPAASVVSTDAVLFDEDGCLTQARHYPRYDTDELPALLMQGFSTICPVLNTSVMVRRACYDKVGLYDPTYQRAQDYEFWVRCAADPTIRFLQVPVPLVTVALRKRRSEQLTASIVSHYHRLIGKMFGLFPVERLFPDLTDELTASECECAPDLARARTFLSVAMAFQLAPAAPLFVDAEEILRRVTATHRTPTGWNLLGVLAICRGRADEARAAFGEALAIDPTHQDARKNLERLGGK